MLSSVKCADPHDTVILDSSVVKRTGAFGSRLAMSARSRPETSTRPLSSTSAWICVRAETS
jgi:hypothetical protein